MAMFCPPGAAGARGVGEYPETGGRREWSGAVALVWLPGEPGKDGKDWLGKIVLVSPGIEPSVGCNGMVLLWAGAGGQCPYCRGR